jgi:nucleoside-diphosphate-sugar epimerase
MSDSCQSSLPREDLDLIVAQTHDVWEQLRGQRIFVTGGTGFFGRWLIESFLWANDRHGLNATMLVLTRDPDAFRNKAPLLVAHRSVEFHPGDVRSFEFPAGSFAACLHAATEADSQVMAADPLQAFDVNVEGTRRVLEFARQAGVRRFLFTSSGAVYGRQPVDLPRIPETFSGGPDPTDTASTYGIPGEAKRAAEALCALYSRQFGLETVIARCFTFVGPHLPLDGKFAIGNFVGDALVGNSILVKGDGTPIRSYLYAADLAVWLWTLLFRGRSGQAYNVGSEDAHSLSTVARFASQLASPATSVRIAITPVLAQAPASYVPSTEKARTELGLRETVDVREAIRRTLLWHSTVCS